MLSKILSIILIISLLFIPAVFADQGERVFLITDFSKGLNSHISEYNVPDNQCAYTQNTRFNEEYGNLSKRDTMLLVVDAGTASVNGGHRYYKSDATQKTIFATSTLLKINNSGTALTIKEGLTDGKFWQFVTYQDIAIGGNGYDNDQKYDGSTSITANTDGHRTALNLCADLGAPFAELNTGANLDAAAWYQYKVAYYDGTNYFYSTARSNAILTGAAVRDVSLTDIPLGVTGITARYIYRTLGNSSKANCEADTTFYKIATLANNTATTADDAMTDDTADNDAVPTWSTVAAGSDVTPPLCKFPIIHDERLFMSGNVTNQSDFYWSAQFKPDYFDPNDYEVARPDDGDKITFLKEQLGILTIGKTNTIQKFYTENVDQDPDTFTEWYMSDPFSFIGCPAPNTAANSPGGIIYLGRDGIYMFTGQQSQLISDAVTPDIQDINQVNIEDCAGVFFNNEYQLAYTSYSSGTQSNNRVLIYDTIRDSYTLDYKNINCFIKLNSGTDFGVLYSGSSDTTGYVYAHESSPNLLIKRYKSEFDAGTFDDTRAFGTEGEPEIEIAWDCTIDGWLTELQTKDASIDTIDSIITYLPNAIIDRPDTAGTWVSEVYYIGAAALVKLYWNEDLGAYGDITWSIKLCDDAACSGESYESTTYTDPNGSDVSGLTADDYVQFRANMSTTDIDYTPNLFSIDGFLLRLIYYTIGSTYETDVLSTWDSGWKDFGVPAYKKEIKRIKIFYQGEDGILTFNYKNEEGDVENSFDIDLAIAPDYDIEDNYTGVGDRKVYAHYPSVNSDDAPQAISQFWRFEITDVDTETTLDTDWTIDKIEIIYTISDAMDRYE